MRPRHVAIPPTGLGIFILCAVLVQAQGIITTIGGGGQSQVNGGGGPAINVPLGLIQGVTTDRQGNVYASDATHFQVVKIAPSGVLTIVAGNGTAGTGGDGGPATSASLQSPGALAVDASGNLFIADVDRVREVMAQGTISTVAGGGQNPYIKEPATQAVIQPLGLLVDSTGNLFIASGDLVQEVTPQGIISTVAGPSTSCCLPDVDNVPANGTYLGIPVGIAMDKNGVLYIAESQTGRIRRVGRDGIITTLAGTKSRGYSGDGGPATAAMLNAPQGIALDSAGDLYFADTNRVREITTDGIIHTVAGTGLANFSGDQGPAALASLSQPAGVATDASGNVYIADSANLCVRRIDPAGTITTYAGNTSLGFAGDGGQARDAILNSPEYIVVDPAGNVFFSEKTTNRVRRIAPNGVITTIAGHSAAGFAGDGGPATQSLLNFPGGLALDPAGNLYIADYENSRVRKVDPSGIITTVAGNGTFNYIFNSGDGGPAIDAQLSPTDIAVDAQGNLYILEQAFQMQWAIRRVSPDGTISTYASGFGGFDFIAIADVNKVYPIDVTIGNGIRLCGSLNGPAFDAQGNAFVPAASGTPLSNVCFYNTVLEITPEGVVTAVAGMSPQAGFAGDDGPATQALLNSPVAVALDATGNLYIADSGNNRIRKVFLNPASGLFQPSLQKTLQPGYYIAAVTLGQGEHPGYWGMQVVASAGVLAGGLNFGGSIQRANQPPGYGGFYVPIAESVHFHVDAQAADGTSGAALAVQLLDASKNPLIDPKFGGTSVDFTQPLSPGYYTMTVTGGANSPLENFQVGLATTEFSGGVNLGGFAVHGSVGFGSFYLTAPQQVNIQVYGQPSLGVDAAGGLRLTLYDANLTIIATVP